MQPGANAQPSTDAFGAEDRLVGRARPLEIGAEVRSRDQALRRDAGDRFGQRWEAELGRFPRRETGDGSMLDEKKVAFGDGAPYGHKALGEIDTGEEFFRRLNGP